MTDEFTRKIKASPKEDVTDDDIYENFLNSSWMRNTDNEYATLMKYESCSTLLPSIYAGFKSISINYVHTKADYISNIESFTTFMLAFLKASTRGTTIEEDKIMFNDFEKNIIGDSDHLLSLPESDNTFFNTSSISESDYIDKKSVTELVICREWMIYYGLLIPNLRRLTPENRGFLLAYIVKLFVAELQHNCRNEVIRCILHSIDCHHFCDDEMPTQDEIEADHKRLKDDVAKDEASEETLH